MRPRPFFIAAGLGALLQTLYAAFSSLLAYFLVPTDLRVLDNLPPYAIGFTTVIGCFGTILAPLVHIGVGILYAYLHRREAPLAAEDGAIGGAASAGTARLISGLFATMTGLFLTPVLVSRLSGPAIPGSPSDGFPFLLIPTLVTAVGGLVGLCFAVAIAAAVGALGGALSSAWANRGTRS
jgi:hypothetical protein